MYNFDYIFDRLMPTMELICPSVQQYVASRPEIKSASYDPITNTIEFTEFCRSPREFKFAGKEISYRDNSPVPRTNAEGFVISSKRPLDDITLNDSVSGLFGFNDWYYPTNPVVNALVSGLVGAGLGYGGASLVSRVLPKSWDKKKFKRLGALAGGALGATPGLASIAGSALINRSPLDGEYMRLENIKRRKLLKESEFNMTARPMHNGPILNSELLSRTVWQSPSVTSRLSENEKNKFSGFMNASSRISGSPFITPGDMARITAGMGVGYASGWTAGKILQSLTGIPAEAQQALARTGAYAGVIKAAIPYMFGR